MKLYIYSDSYVVHAYNANDYDHQIMSGTLTMEFNRSGSLTFTVPPNNEAHKNGWIKDLVSVICVKNLADDFIWYGRVLNHNPDFLGSCTYTCEGALGRLNDICAYPVTEPIRVNPATGNEYRLSWYLHHGWPKYNDLNPDPELSIGSGPLFNAIVQQYNDRLQAFGVTRFDYSNPGSPYKKFEVSYYGDDPLVQDKSFDSRKNASYENALDYIQSTILNYGEYGFHVELGRRNGCDLLILRSNDPKGYDDPNTGKISPNFYTSSKALIFGKNLLDFSYKTDYSNVYNAMHFKANVRAVVEPSGGLDEGKDFTTTREWVYPLEANPGYYNPNDYEYITKYGLLMGHEDLDGDFFYEIRNDDANSINTAYRIATERFHEAAIKRVNQLSSAETETIEIKSMNLVGTDDTIPFRIYQYIPVISDYHNIKAKYLCTAITIDLCNPANSTFILGSRPDGATEKWVSIAKQELDDIAQYYTEEVI